MKKLLFTLVSLIVLVNFDVFAQPANNNCSTAQSLGSLPTTGSCSGGLQNGAPVTVSGTTIGATATNPAVSILNCQSGSSDQAAPALDVWYSFVATGTTVNVNITPGTPALATPNIGLWTGSCSNLLAWGCGIGNSGGNLSASFTQIVIGQTYYIQVSGNNSTSSGNFNLSVDNDIDCNNCNTVASITANPTPVLGAYLPGQVVTFCYTVSDWSQQNTNWFHGLQISMGAGWTGTISGTVPAATCQSIGGYDGAWIYSNTGLGTTFGPGFYFETVSGATDASNNFGDNCSGTGKSWTFCWNLTVDPGCAAGSDLSVTVNTSGDGESGSWYSTGCTGDPALVLPAQGACCQPTMTSSPTCIGQSTGTATATPVGAGTFTYSWAPGGQTTQTATGLAAGTYTVTVTNTATLCAITNTIIVTTTPLPVSNAGADISLCSGISGSIGAAATSGTTYLWTPTTGLSSTTSANPTVTLTNTGSTTITSTYTITTTTTATGCISTDQVIVSVKPSPVLVIPANISQCAGTIVAASVLSSTPLGAAYTWTNSNTAIGLAASGTGNVPSFTSANTTTSPITATITITPTLNGCAGPPATYTITIQPSAISTFTQTPNQCLAGNSFSFTNTGSSASGYTYSWNFGGGGSNPATSISNDQAGVIYSTPGTYSITHIVTAVGGCSATSTSTVTIYSAPTAIVTIPVSATCGLNDGSVTLGAVTGGTAGYSYSFNGSGFTSSTSYTALPPGTYTVIVKDANGCTYTTTVTITTTPGPTALAVTTVNSTCGASNGVINIGAVTGGVGPYSYSVNGSAFSTTTSYTGFAAGTYTVIVKETQGCPFTVTATIVNTPGPTALATTTINSTCGIANGTVNIGAVTGGTATYVYSFNSGAFSATASYTGLAPGTYSTIVKDANGCTFTTSSTITNTPGPTALAISTVNATCGISNGIINIGAVTGGIAPYTYSVNAGAYSASTSYPGYAAGTYTVIVKDANGCTFSNTATVVDIPGPTAIVITTDNSNCGASNGDIDLGTVTGGIPAYTYSVNGSPFDGTVSYNGFSEGTYTVIVKDANGCTFTTSAFVSSNSGPTALAVSSTNSTCGSSNATVTIGAVTDGTGPYTYSFDGSGYTATVSYPGLPAGTYNVVVKDNNGCTFATSTIVTNFPVPTALTVTTVNSTCGASNGIINIGAVTGGAGPFTYSVNASAFTSVLVYSGFAAGTYNVIVKDGNGCTFNTTAIVADTPGPTAIATTLTNTTCGNSIGSIVLGTVTGGTASYTYSVDGSAFSLSTIYSSLAAASYSIIVKDNNGCIFTTSATLTDTPGPTALATSITNTTCGNSNGTITIGAATGGTPTYTYSFNGGGFSSIASFTGLAAATYSVIVKDANGCTYTVNPVIINAPGPTALATSTIDASCGASNGSVSMGATTGGTAPYTYSVNGSAFTSSTLFSGLAANTYPVIVQDAIGCSFSTSVTINDLSGLTASLTAQTNVSCNGGNNGSVTVAAAGSTAPYSYSIDGGVFGASGTFGGLIEGIYTVMAKDGNGCTVSITITITQPSELTGVITLQTDVNCIGGDNGAVAVTASGGTIDYTYSIDGGVFGSNPSFSNLLAGSHSVVIKDANGCTVNISVTITQPTALLLASSSTSATCTASNGSATVVASGATPSYSYLWTPGGQITSTANNITAGTYSVLVTDAKGCGQTAPVIVGVNPGGTASISASNNVTCTGANNGNATVSMSTGATPPYTYSWIPSGQTAVTANSLAPGLQTVTVIDGNGCIATAGIVITEPIIISALFTNVNLACNGLNNGLSTAYAIGGTAPYTYLWSPTSQITQTAGGLTAGTYTCTITDANGCTKTETTSITQPVAMVLTETHADANCNLSNGSATVSATGGVGLYTYSWNTIPVQTTAAVTGLASNTYIATVTDLNGCSQNIPVTVNNLAGPIATVFSTTNVACKGQHNGNVTVTVSGGTNPYTYLWSDGQTFPTATNLAAGTYTLTATDVNGCVAAISAIITEPLALTTTFTSANPVCFGASNGTITTAISGGTGGYSYLWSPGGATTSSLSGLAASAYILQVTDANGCIAVTNITLNDPPVITATTTTTNVTCSGLCNGTATVGLSSGSGPITYLWNDVNAQATPTATALCAGTYTVTAIDANGCSVTATASITSPASLTVNIASSGNVSCYGACDGYALATVTGGSAPFNFLWNPGGTVGSSVNNLCAASYTATVTDVNGCTATVTVLITQPNPFITTINNTNVTCFNACDAQATAVYSGGTGPYTFMWTPSLQTSAIATALCAGIQNLEITDSHGCAATNSVVITEPTLLAVSTTTNSDCGTANGAACAQVIGGFPPFVYSWNDPATQTTSCASALNAGVYTISITDNHGCSITKIVNVNDNDAPVVTIPTSTDITCNGADNGSAQGTILGGILPYTINWTPGGMNTTFINNLSGGVYSLLVSDSVGCTGSASVTINEPAPLTTGITTFINASCNLSCDGSATVLANGGNAPYTYLWTDVGTQTSSTATGLCAQTYSVTTTDAKACTSIAIAEILQPSLISISLVSLTNVICNGGNNGQITISATGGTQGYTFSWVPSVGSNSMITNLFAGTYQVTVTDLNGCSKTVSFNILEPAPLVLTANSNPSTCSNPNGSAGVSVTGGIAPYAYSWTPTGSTTAIITNVIAGTYNVTVTGFNGCIATGSSTILDLSGPTINSISYTQPLCNGTSTGTATVSATGGQPLYTYLWTGLGAQTSQTASALPAGPYTISVSDQNNCTSTGYILIPQPTPVQVITSPTDTICIGQLSQIYGAGSGGTPLYTPNGPPTYTYTWIPASFDTTGGPFSVTPTITSTYTVIAMDSNGCVSPPTITTVFVNPQIEVTATDVSLCNGDSVSIYATATGGNGGPYTYSWNNGSSTQSQTVSPSGGTSVNYIVTANDIGCSIAVIDTATVIINPLAVSFMTVADTSGCENVVTQFTGISNIGIIYSWDFGDGTPAQTGNPISHIYVTQGIYDVSLTVTTDSGCVSTITTNQYIDVYPVPVAGFSSSPSQPTLTNPMVSFTDQSVGATNWYWDFIYNTPPVGLFTDTLQNPSFTYADTGSYIVEQIVHNNFGCYDTAYNTVKVFPEYILFVPNAFTPSDPDGINDLFMPKGVGIDPDNFKMMIFDRWGDLIYETTDLAKGWNGRANGGKDVAQIDVYIWKILTKDYKGGDHSYVGTVTIVK